MTRERALDPRGRELIPLSPGERLLSPQQAAQLFGVSLRTIRRLVASGELRCVRVGRLVRFHPGDVSRWLSAHTE
jgi:excisionase family DNA binding protein